MMKNILICTVVLFSSLACNSREKNYIVYYQKVNKIDSINRIANKPYKAIRQYRRLFKKYEPKNQDIIQEYETYIKLSDKYEKNFGGKESLNKLITLVAPYGEEHIKYFSLFSKYGIDSTDVKNQIKNWKNGLNKTLIDSFSTAMVRDQLDRPNNSPFVQQNVEKNMNLFLWTFENYGFPNANKISRIGNDGVFIAMHTLVSHMAASKNYSNFEGKIFEYLKSGDVTPLNYAVMVDTIDRNRKDNPTLYHYRANSIKDSTTINRNRKSIGLPSLRHWNLIRKDYSKNIKRR